MFAFHLADSIQNSLAGLVGEAVYWVDVGDALKRNQWVANQLVSSLFDGDDE